MIGTVTRKAGTVVHRILASPVNDENCLGAVVFGGEAAISGDSGADEKV